ncbi:MAG TPA: uroporphyrinogen decarboxylase [Candidatus Obscuribacterales bacterium]
MRSETPASKKTGAELLESSPFMRACLRQSVERTPIWIMRQAGRFMPEYRSIREKVSFIELCENSELAAEVTVMAVEKLGVDAAIIFSDILLPLKALGAGLEYARGDGPFIHHPVRSPEDVKRLRNFEVAEELAHVFKAVTLARKSLPADIPLIGFAGAPFTLASYLIEGGSSRNFERTKAFMYSHRQSWDELMQLLSVITSSHLNAQIEAGAQAVQLFDSWVGCLGQDDYTEYVLPHSARVIAAVTDAVPVIHFGTGTAALLELMQQAGGDVIGVDWRIELSEAWKRLNYATAVQGNLDPCVLFADKDEIERRVKRILKHAGGRPGHIFNLGHGVLPQTPFENVKFLVDVVRELGHHG